jgi:hypothetical protein
LCATRGSEAGRNNVAPVQAADGAERYTERTEELVAMKKMIFTIVLIFSHPAMAAGSSVPWRIRGNPLLARAKPN